MRLTAAVSGALSLSLLAAAAAADPLPWPPQIQLPAPITLQQLAPVEWAELAKAAQTCAPVEIAPGMFVPIPCAESLPRIPVDAPTIELPAYAVTPAYVDLRAQRVDGPVKDQKQTGVCYAFALSSALENSLRRQGRPEVLSPLHVIAADAWSDLWTGKPREAIAQEAAWPYDPVKACELNRERDSCEQTYGVRANSWQSDASLSAERERVRGQGVAWTGQAHALKKNPIDQIVTALAGGREVFLDLGIDSTAWGYRGVGSGVLPEYEVADRGGHAVTIAGYRQAGAERQFLLHNSWGPRWADGGYAWISERGLRAHMMDAYLVEALPLNAQVVTQSPPVATPATCAPGTGMDVATGRCAQTCPSGLAPFGGRCWLG